MLYIFFFWYTYIMIYDGRARENRNGELLRSKGGFLI